MKQWFLKYNAKSTSDKRKIDKFDLMKLKSFCAAKESINDKKTTLRIGENICKRINGQRINLQNI